MVAQLVRGLTGPLLSIPMLDDSGYATSLKSPDRYVADASGTVALEVGRHPNGLYTVSNDAMIPEELDLCDEHVGRARAVSGSSLDWADGEWEVWHSRMAHLSVGEMSRLFKSGAVTGVTVRGEIPRHHVCPHCIAGKLAETPFKRLSRKRDAPLDLIHMDLMGPLHLSVERAVYVLVVVDDYSRYTWVRGLKKKDEAEDILMDQLIPLMERQYGHQLRGVRSDRGGEFLSNRFCR